MNRRPRWRWVVPTAMLIGAASAALAPAGPDALLPFEAATAAAADSVYVAFVVDFGQGFGGFPQVASGCVKVPAGQNGYDGLSDFAPQMNWSSPSYNSSGLLCSIDGYPGSGCGQPVASGYNYWSYWHGDGGTWAYSNSGASRTLQTGDVEGWRFENPGRGSPSDPPPAANATFASICTAAAMTPPTPADVTTTTAGAPSGPGPAGSSSPTLPGAGPSSANPATGSGPLPTTPATGPPASTTTVPGGSTPHPGSAGTNHPRGQALARAGSGAAQHGGDSVIPLVLGGIVVALLALGAIFFWRRHPGVQ